MSGTFNSNTNTTPAEPSSRAQAQGDLMDQPITPLPVTPLAPKPDDAANPILASSGNAVDDASNPNSAAFKPQVFRKKSTNYEDAAKRASFSATHPDAEPAMEVSGQAEIIMDPSSRGSSGIGQLVDTHSKQKGPEDGAAGYWQPKIERKQSWDVQDWKHDLQKAVAEGEKKGNETFGLGFTETGGINTKRYSQS